MEGWGVGDACEVFRVAGEGEVGAKSVEYAATAAIGGWRIRPYCLVSVAMFSRRELLRIASTALACAAFVPLALTKVPGLNSGPGRYHVEVHFTGKHAFAHVLDEAKAENWQALPMGELVGRVGTSLLDTPYVNHTLDHSPDTEFCIVNLQELDCVTFVETTLALARSIKLGLTAPGDLAKQIQLFRYRDGFCDGFCSRLHYLSDWFYDNQRRGLITAYTSELPGAAEVVKDISLMSSRPNQYTQLRKHPEWVPVIAKQEKLIAARPIVYIPKSAVAANEKLMQTGDIIGITTSANILDCAHTGFCYRDDKGVLRFLHASMKHKKVYLDEELSKYLATVHAFTGIMLARPLEPQVMGS